MNWIFINKISDYAFIAKTICTNLNILYVFVFKGLSFLFAHGFTSLFGLLSLIYKPNNGV